MLPVLTSNKRLSIKQLKKATWSHIEIDLSGASANKGARFVVGVDFESLFFLASAKLPTNCDNSLSAGRFKVELWKLDVAELFIAEDKTDRYQEFNLSPTGAWWSMGFDHYRSEAANFRPPTNVVCTSWGDNERWYSSIVVPRQELWIDCSWTDRSRANVCFILGEGKRSFLSWEKLESESPDFHLTEQFEAIRVVTFKKVS